jgi:RNA recognition motif-containing protein
MCRVALLHGFQLCSALTLNLFAFGVLVFFARASHCCSERATIQRDRTDGKALGMGFVVFRREEDADTARLALHKHAYGYQILNVEKAQPRSNRPQQPRQEIRTGYGKALPQGHGGPRP